jgi:small ligand-binding sensory domain FIST
MHEFSNACADGGDWRTLADTCLDRLGTLPEGTNVGFVYITDAVAADFDALVTRLRDGSGIEHWVGTVGMGISCGDQEYYETPAAAVMTASFAPDSFRVFGSLDAHLNELEDEHGDWRRRHDAGFAVVHGDPRSPVTAGLIPAFAGTEPSTYLIGGLTSSNSEHFQYADGLCEGSLSGILFAGDVPVATTVSQGCSPLGPQRVITDSDANVINTIDGRPALDVFNEDIGEVLARDLRRAAGYVFVGLPIPGSDTGDYLVRNLVGVDTQGRRLGVGDMVRNGQPVMFCRRDGVSAWEDLERAMDSLLARVDRPIRGALYFSCLGRGRHLFGENSEELKYVQERLGGVPLVGFFANGEIANDQLYGYTGVLTVFL